MSVVLGDDLVILLVIGLLILCVIALILNMRAENDFQRFILGECIYFFALVIGALAAVGT